MLAAFLVQPRAKCLLLHRVLTHACSGHGGGWIGGSVTVALQHSLERIVHPCDTHSDVPPESREGSTAGTVRSPCVAIRGGLARSNRVAHSLIAA